MDARTTGLLALLLLLVGAAGAVLVREAVPWQHPDPADETFQHLVGGLGFGPAVDLSGCARGFDPRLDATCGQNQGPVAAGACFCPRHAGTILTLPSSRRMTPSPPPESSWPPSSKSP